ncbi:Diablo, mitochondrial [Liparis tanakae]|uniref:Direct IAP-binding protein with low pI n=1 Tax=Liparis tanakae TaxID=230148 RepID=A0A4Z2HB28_9TELE|nr:Diablo, mitochondrial [Liparis tanakae]
MAALRKVTTCFRLLRSAAPVLFGSRKPAVLKAVKWRNIVYTGIGSLTVGGGLCAIPFKQVDTLSHDSLIRRAASLVTDSSSTFLSQSTLALIDAITEYSKVSDRQDEWKRFESTWVSAFQLCETAAEAAYTSGAEHASVTVRTNMQVAESQVEKARKLSVDTEKKLAEAKVMEVERVTQDVSSSHEDEEEVPEAYLRED